MKHIKTPLKHRGASRKIANLARLAALAVSAIPLSRTVNANTFYWDSNGSTTGAGTVPTGTWGSAAYWSTNANGSGSNFTAITTATDTLTFSAGTDATNAYTVTVSGTQYAQKITIEEGSPTFTGGQISLGAVGWINVLATASATINSDLYITGPQTLNVASGGTLTLSGGTFARSTGAVLSSTGSGTIIANMTGLSQTDLVDEIVGAWATIGTGTNTQYATINSSNQLVSYTGVTAANATELTDTTGTTNYELASGAGTVQSSVSVNTIRYTGGGSVTTLGSTLFSVNGLLNAGIGAWTISGNTLTIGSSQELVVNSANKDITINSVIADNANGTSSLTKTGAANLYLTGSNTYSGKTTIDGGQLYFSSIGDVGSGASALGAPTTVDNGTIEINGATLFYNGTTDVSSNRNIVVNSTGVIKTYNTGALTLSGTISATNATSMTVGSVNGANLYITGKITGSLLNGLYVNSGSTGAMTVLSNDTNDFSGPLTIQQGTLVITSIADAGTACAIGAGNMITFGNYGYNWNQTLQFTGTNGGSSNKVMYFYSANNGTPTIEITNTVAGQKLTLSGSFSYTGPATNVAATLLLDGAGDGEMSGQVGGTAANMTGSLTSFSIVKSGSGTWTLSGTNVYSGTTSVQQGTLAFTNVASGTAAQALGEGSTVTLGVSGSSNAATLQYTGTAGTLDKNIYALGSGLNTIENSGSGVLTLSGSLTNNGTSLVLNADTNGILVSGIISGTSANSNLYVTGGTMTLTGTATASGTVAVSAGATLDNNGVVNGNMSVSGLLKGSGTLNGSLALSGTLAPGNSPGITTINGDLTMDSTAVLSMEVTGTEAGTSYDQLKVSGNVTLAGTLDLSSLSGLSLGDTITLIDNTGTGTTTSGYFTEIITSGSTYTITGSSSTYTVVVNGVEYLLNYAASTDEDSVYNDVTLTVVPEPSTWAMIAGGVGILLGYQKRRRRS